MSDKLIKWMKLTRVPGLGPSKIMKLFNLFQDINEIFSTEDNELLRTRIFSEKMLSEFSKLKKASDENFSRVIEECVNNGILIIPLIDEKYPQSLKRVNYPPLTLFLKGEERLIYSKKIAIVGSRNADENAKKWAYDLAQDLAEQEYTIISGGAVGIDYSAHRGALDANGKTICVLGSGFFKMFPEKHSDLFNEISKKGLLVSEHLPNFPGSNIALVQRNRITSGLSDLLVTVASSEKGGSMIQTKMAFEQRVPIFCPDASLNLSPNQGIPQIIREWNGKTMRSSEDVLSFLKNQKKSAESVQSKLAQ